MTEGRDETLGDAVTDRVGHAVTDDDGEPEGVAELVVVSDNDIKAVNV